MIVLDSSAILAFLQSEPGADVVERALDGGVVGAANWSEVAQKVAASSADWSLARALLRSYGLRIEPVTETDAESAADVWIRGSRMSLGDRLCLALAARLGVQAMTADSAWGTDGVIQIRSRGR